MNRKQLPPLTEKVLQERIGWNEKAAYRRTLNRKETRRLKSDARRQLKK